MKSYNLEMFFFFLFFLFLVFIGVRVCTSDAYVSLSVCVCALLIMVDSGRWLYLVVTFIEVKAKLVVASLRAKTGINAIFSLSKKNISYTDVSNSMLKHYIQNIKISKSKKNIPMLDLFVIFILRNVMFERNFKTKLWLERKKYLKFGINLPTKI
jgi:hypothetical protein